MSNIMPLVARRKMARGTAALMALLSPAPTSIDDLIRLTKLPPSQVAATLLDLELEGVLVGHAGARVALG